MIRLPLVLLIQSSIVFHTAAAPAGSSTRPQLADAAEAKDWARVDRLLAAGSAVDAVQPDGMSALHWAAYWGNGAAVSGLIGAGADIAAETRYGLTPLAIACRERSPTVVKRLLDAGADANATAAGGESPLMTAARTGDAATVRTLIQHGAAVDAVELRGQTALMWAASDGNSEAVSALIEAGADIRKKTKKDFTAVMFAAREGRAGVVDLLLAAGADVNAVMNPKQSGGRAPRRGTSALMLAVESGHFELALRLVHAGANPNDQRSGYAPLHAVSWVRKTGRGDNPEGDPAPRGSGGLTSLQFVRQIAAAGADANLRLMRGEGGRAKLNPRGATPLLLAARTADAPLVALLVELGADPLLPNTEGCTPLLACAGVGVQAVGEEAGTEPEVIETLELLLSLGAEVNTIDGNLETAMHGAAYRNFPRVVEFLASHGADPRSWDHKNAAGWTPVRIAQGYRPGSFKPSPETVAALRRAKDE